MTHAGQADALAVFGTLTQAQGDARYLKLDASNDPVTAPLTVGYNLDSLFSGLINRQLTGSRVQILPINTVEIGTFGYLYNTGSNAGAGHGIGSMGWATDTATGQIDLYGAEGRVDGKGTAAGYYGLFYSATFTGTTFTGKSLIGVGGSSNSITTDGSTPLAEGKNIVFYAPACIGGATKYSFFGKDTLRVDNFGLFYNLAGTQYMSFYTDVFSQITSSTGLISFDDEGLLTTGTLGAGAITGTSFTGKLRPTAGTTVADTAGLKFLNSVLRTVKELGDVDFIDPNLFLTVQDSGTLSAELFTSFAANQWTITTGWTLPSGTSLVHSTSATGTATYTGFTPVIGVTYRLRINYSAFATGSVVTSFAGTTNTARVAGETGSVTYTITATSTAQLVFTPSGTTACTVNVISIFAYTKLAVGFVLDNGTRLVTGQMPRISTDGRLISDTAFTWSGTGFTITPSATQGTTLTIAGSVTPYANPTGPIIGIYSKRSTSGSTTGVFNVNTLQTESYNATAITGGVDFNFYRAFSIYGDAQSSGAHTGVFTILAIDRTVGIFANASQEARTITGSKLLLEAQGIWVTPQVKQITYNKVGGTITLQPTGINSDMTIASPTITNGTMNLTATGLLSAISYAGGYNGTVVGYGVFVDVKNDFGAGKTWAFYNSGTYGNNAFGVNNSSFGMTATTVPTAKVHIGAGTATASTAPVKYTAGVLLTVPEAGVKEFNGDYFYQTRVATRARIVGDADALFYENEAVAIDNELVLV